MTLVIIGRKEKDPIQYKISAETKVAIISMGKLLAHYKIKDDLTHFLSEKFLKAGVLSNKTVIVSWRDRCCKIVGSSN